MCLWYTAVNTPFGNVYIIGNKEHIRYIGLKRPSVSVSPCDDIPLLKSTAKEVRAFICGDKTHITLSCPVTLSPFQREVFDAVGRIPYGTHRTYDDIAVAIGKPQAAHAVRQICLANPFWPVYPTHRATDPHTPSDEYGKADEAMRQVEKRCLPKP